MERFIDVLTSAGLLDAGVLAVGLERKWASLPDVGSFAAECLGLGDERSEVVKLSAAEELAPDQAIEMLREWARLDGLASVAPAVAMRPWLFAALKTIMEGGGGPDEKLDRLEEVYAMFGYPEELRECSRYYVPDGDRLRGIRVGEKTESPLVAMERLLSRFGSELRVR